MFGKKTIKNEKVDVSLSELVEMCKDTHYINVEFFENGKVVLFMYSKDFTKKEENNEESC